MKASILSLIFLLTAAATQAQLKNTKWQGNMNIPNEAKVILDFKTDSVDILVGDAGQVIETMVYAVKDSIITLKKTSGNSPCNVGDEFKIKYKISDDKMWISNFSDPCDPRVQAWVTDPYVRVKQ
jgi:hypothetical protein